VPRILICGLGSVGTRHLRNLRAMGHNDVAAFRARGLDLGEALAGVPTFDSLETALRQYLPEVALVTNPTAMHMETALACARAGCHVFIEKPLSHDEHGIDDLIRELRHNERLGMVGYMLRFHPLFRQVKEWVALGEQGPIGRIIWMRTAWGEHLPDWHPSEDYTTSYAARADLGGGPELTLSHELDLVAWLMDSEPVTVLKLKNCSAPLPIAVPHGVDMLFAFANGATANVHVDYFQVRPSRQFEIVGTGGRAVLDYYAGRLTLYPGRIGEPAADAAPQEIEVPAEWDRNDMFVSELGYFMQCLAEGRQPQPSIEAAARVVRMAIRGGS
jgi:predicted dehydrogenase